VHGDCRSRACPYFFEGSAIIMWDVSDIIPCDVSDIIILESSAAAAGFSPFAQPAMATTAMTNAKRFMRAPSSRKK
jgi:hypothetical protein